MTLHATTKHLVLVDLDASPDTAAYRTGLESGTYPFIVTRYEDAGRPFVEVHAMTPYAESVLRGFRVRSQRPEMTDNDIDKVRDEVTEQIIKGVLGMTLVAFDEARGKFKAPSGSSYEESLRFVHSDARAFLLSKSVA